MPVEWVRGLMEEEPPEDEGVDLTVHDVAALLDRAPSTIRTWCGAGRFPGAYRLQGREWRIPRADLRGLRDPMEGDSSGDGGPVDLGAWRTVHGAGR